MSMDLLKFPTKTPPYGLPEFLYIHVGLAQFGEHIGIGFHKCRASASSSRRAISSSAHGLFSSKSRVSGSARRFWRYRRKSVIDGLRGGFPPVHARYLAISPAPLYPCRFMPSIHLGIEQAGPHDAAHLISQDRVPPVQVRACRRNRFNLPSPEVRRRSRHAAVRP